jgi:DNA modification methylase
MSGPDVEIIQGDCRVEMARIESGTVDAVITDPPYPEIDRPYGRLSEPEWHALMDVVVTECRRILKLSGSVMFVLQANQEFVGRTRAWLWEFLAKWSREWNQVQDIYWWNTSAPPTVHCQRTNGLTRPSLKWCVWLGDPGCYRDQDSVLMNAAEATLSDKRVERHELSKKPSGQSMRYGRALATFRERGGVTPFNLLPIANSDSQASSGTNGHGAGTPHDLADWWVRYISPPDGLVCDPFAGVGTIPIAALQRKRRVIAIERHGPYVETMKRRIERPHLVVPRARMAAGRPTPLFDAIGEGVA